MTTRSRPPSLRATSLRCVRDEGLFARGDLVLVATSGGPDSQALLSVLALLRREVGHGLVACGIDHGLRPEARAELALAEALAEGLDVPFVVRRVEVSPPREGAASNLQARARRERLVALGHVARELGAAAIAVGHTADDRVETFLLRLLRGAGPAGLAVLPPRAAHPFRDAERPFVELVRPLVTARRADVLRHLERHEVAFASDPSNADPRFSRTRVRAELLPLCEELSPGFFGHVLRLSTALGEGAAPAGVPGPQLEALLRGLRLLQPAEILLPGGRVARLTFSAPLERGHSGSGGDAEMGLAGGSRRLRKDRRAEAPLKVAARKLRD